MFFLSIGAFIDKLKEFKADTSDVRLSTIIAFVVLLIFLALSAATGIGIVSRLRSYKKAALILHNTRIKLGAST